MGPKFEPERHFPIQNLAQLTPRGDWYYLWSLFLVTEPSLQLIAEVATVISA